MLVFPPASDPPGVLKPVEHAIYRGSGALCGLHDGPAMQFRIAVRCTEKDVKDVEERTRDPNRTSHTLILPKSR
jgi:hypothetical protein